MNLVSPVVAHKETVQAVFGNSRDLVRRIDSRSRPIESEIADIRREDLDSHLRNRGRFAGLAGGPQKFEKNHRQGVNLLPGGASGDPDSQRAILGFAVLQQVRKYFLAQTLKGFFITEKLGDMNQQVPEQCIEFGRIAFDVTEVFLKFQDVVQDHSPLDPPLQRALLVVPEVHSHRFVQKSE